MPPKDERYLSIFRTILVSSCKISFWNFPNLNNRHASFEFFYYLTSWELASPLEATSRFSFKRLFDFFQSNSEKLGPPKTRHMLPHLLRTMRYFSISENVTAISFAGLFILFHLPFILLFWCLFFFGMDTFRTFVFSFIHSSRSPVL